MRLGANEEVPMRVEADTAAEMPHEVITADKIRTAGKPALKERLVKAQALPSDACLHFGTDVLKPRRKDAVEVIKKWPVRLESRIQTAAALPGNLTADSHVSLEKDVGAEHRISSAVQAHGNWIAEGVEASWRANRADAESCIELLRGQTRGE